MGLGKNVNKGDTPFELQCSYHFATIQHFVNGKISQDNE